jgi:hypothetical protein
MVIATWRGWGKAGDYWPSFGAAVVISDAGALIEYIDFWELPKPLD